MGTGSQGGRLQKLREKAWTKQEGLCFYCYWPITLVQAVAEHLVPRSAGGRANVANIVASCDCCNQRKMTMSAEQFLKSPGFMQILVGRRLFVPFKRTRGWRRRHRRMIAALSGASPKKKEVPVYIIEVRGE